MFQTWTFWGLLLVAMIFNGFYTSFQGQRQVSVEPVLKRIELAYARRQQRWSGICILIAMVGGYADWRLLHRGWFSLYQAVSLVLTVAVIGLVYAWHGRMISRLPDPPVETEPAESGP